MYGYFLPWGPSGPDRKEFAMFDVFCDECGHTVLVNHRRIRGLVNLAPGVIALELQCPVGHQVRILTGRATQEQTVPRSS